MKVRYAKKTIYADVEEEGGTTNRLVAVAGQAVPTAYAHLVADEDTTDAPPSAPHPGEGRSTSARRSTTPSVAEAEKVKGNGGAADGAEGGYKKLKAPALKAELKKRGIEFPKGAVRNATLIELLEADDAKKAAE